jgi:4-diphosphocytidyl-2-C-methyl-D-erythritol kinase
LKTLYDLAAPAKINWFLHITGRRADKRHTLQSVMQLTSLQDTLHIETTATSAITREGAPELGADDLCVRAAQLLQSHARVKHGCHIRLEKRIPTGAGLGGGSSDAATVLLALNSLWNTRLTRAQLQALGLKLGADVPFFIFGETAFAQSTGEALTPTAAPEVTLLLIKPAQSVATALAFAHNALPRGTERLEPQPDWSVARIASATRNDMQTVAQLIAPEVTLALELAKSYGVQRREATALARMSGSGSAVFSLANAGDVLPPVPNGWFAAHATTLAVHPLRQLGC